MGPNVRHERRRKGREAAFAASARWRGLSSSRSVFRAAGQELGSIATERCVVAGKMLRQGEKSVTQGLPLAPQVTERERPESADRTTKLVWGVLRLLREQRFSFCALTDVAK